MNFEIKWKQVHEDAKQPTKKEGDACHDLYVVPDKTFLDGKKNNGKPYRWLYPGESYLFDTGIQLEIPNGLAMFLWDRSGLSAKHGIHRLAGVIDSSYRNNIKVALINLSTKYYKISSGDRIVQAWFSQVLPITWNQVDKLECSDRGDGGFGSSGK